MIYDKEVMAFIPSEGQSLDDLCRDYMSYSASMLIPPRLFYDNRYYDAADFNTPNELYLRVARDSWGSESKGAGRCDDPTPDLSESTYAKQAAEYRMIFDSYRLVGFSTDQSFELLKIHIKKED